MKKILSLLLAAVILVCLVGCGNNSGGAKERKRAAKGQNTVTAEVSKQEEVTLDTGLLNPLDKTYAKSNKPCMKALF